MKTDRTDLQKRARATLGDGLVLIYTKRKEDIYKQANHIQNAQFVIIIILAGGA